MNAKHTPSPLSIRKTGPAPRYLIETGNGTHIGTTFTHEDALLYSAAPELLAVLKTLTIGDIQTCPKCDGDGKEPHDPSSACGYCGGCGEVVTGTIWPDDFRQALKVIAKAEGK